MHRSSAAGAAVTLLAIAACSNDESPDRSRGEDTGGLASGATGATGGPMPELGGTGGNRSGGGTSSGAAPATGGSSVGGTGGLPSSGGVTSSGGGPSTGGLSATGGGGGTGAILTGGSMAAGGEAGTSAGGTAGVPVVETGGSATGGAGGASNGASTCHYPPGSEVMNATVPPGFCAWVWADALGSPRGATINGAGDLLVVDSSQDAVVLLYDDDGDGVSGATERVELANVSGINHGVAISGGFLYASSETTIYRWSYSGGRSPLSGESTVVTGLPSGGHRTRTLAFDGSGYLYVSVGSESNLDDNSDRARVIRFSPSQLEAGASFGEAEVWGDGTRNEVGLRFDAQGRLWGVENGSDNLDHPDMGDIHEDNPGEEVNLFEQPGAFYGYPDCWSEGLLPSEFAQGPGTQWAYPSSDVDDAWCRAPANVVPPVMVMQAHSAPLDIIFYSGSSFPADFVGDALVSFHGSWNRSAETGYKVVRLPCDDAGMPTGSVEPLLEYSGSGDTGSDWPHRPVGLAVTPDGKLLVTSDASGVVIAVGYDGS